MTLNYDCIRDVLLYLEDTLEYTDNPVAMTHKRLTINNVANALSSYSKEDVQYTIEKLYEARYIRIVDVSTDSQRYMINGYMGHADIGVTLETYTHINNEQLRNEIKKLEYVSE